MGLSFSLADIFTNRKEENGSFFFLFMADFFGFWRTLRPVLFKGFLIGMSVEIFCHDMTFCVLSFIYSILTWSYLFDIRKFKKPRIFKILKPLKFFCKFTGDKIFRFYKF